MVAAKPAYLLPHALHSTHRAWTRLQYAFSSARPPRSSVGVPLALGVLGCSTSRGHDGCCRRGSWRRWFAGLAAHELERLPWSPDVLRRERCLLRCKPAHSAVMGASTTTECLGSACLRDQHSRLLSQHSSQSDECWQAVQRCRPGLWCTPIWLTCQSSPCWAGREAEDVECHVLWLCQQAKASDQSSGAYAEADLSK